MSHPNKRRATDPLVALFWSRTTLPSDLIGVVCSCVYHEGCRLPDETDPLQCRIREIFYDHVWKPGCFNVFTAFEYAPKPPWCSSKYDGLTIRCPQDTSDEAVGSFQSRIDEELWLSCPSYQDEISCSFSYGNVRNQVDVFMKFGFPETKTWWCNKPQFQLIFHSLSKADLCDYEEERSKEEHHSQKKKLLHDLKTLIDKM